nr:flagellar hook-length control protein FliK [Sphingomonas sp. dw_22]
MRDASATGDTRIRLAPDALGQVDISIRHEGDRIHVHFATETQAARQLLSDAQPRLSELAEARGVKLGQTSVDGGTAGSGQQQNAATRQPAPPRPAGAAAEAAADTDQRIA